MNQDCIFSEEFLEKLIYNLEPESLVNLSMLNKNINKMVQTPYIINNLKKKINADDNITEFDELIMSSMCAGDNCNIYYLVKYFLKKNDLSTMRDKLRATPFDLMVQKHPKLNISNGILILIQFIENKLEQDSKSLVRELFDRAIVNREELINEFVLKCSKLNNFYDHVETMFKYLARLHEFDLIHSLITSGMAVVIKTNKFNIFKKMYYLYVREYHVDKVVVSNFAIRECAKDLNKLKILDKIIALNFYKRGNEKIIALAITNTIFYKNYDMAKFIINKYIKKNLEYEMDDAILLELENYINKDVENLCEYDDYTCGENLVYFIDHFNFHIPPDSDLD